MNWLEKLKNKKKVMSRTSWKGSDDFHDWYKKSFNYKHGKGASETSGLDYAKGYDYKPNVLEKFLDKVPGVGGYRDYQRASDYKSRVHYNPDESRAADKMMERSVNVTGKKMSDFQALDDRMLSDRFSGGSTQIATEDPRNFSSNIFASDDDRSWQDTFVHGTKSGHVVSERERVGAYRGRSMDPYNITTSKMGSKFLGIFPRGYEGKITSNVAEGGGSKLDPYVNPETLRSQVMGNKNLALANESYYKDKDAWDRKKSYNKVVAASNQRRGYAE